MTESTAPKVSIKVEDEDAAKLYELEYTGDSKNYYKYKLTPEQEGLFILRTLYVHKEDVGGE